MIYSSTLNWSGGKDSALALYKVLNDKRYKINYLTTTVNDKYNRISMHGVREILLDNQADSLGIDLKKIYLSDQNISMNQYNKIMKSYFENTLLKDKVTHSIFGDIFLEDLMQYRKEKLKEVGIKAYFPLKNMDSKQVIKMFLELGFKTVVVCIDSSLLDVSFLGQEIDNHFIKQLPKQVDICGENGEFHTFVFDGPIFKIPIRFKRGEIVRKSYIKPNNELSKKTFDFIDLIPL